MMKSKVDVTAHKLAIADAFGRAAGHYDKHAQFQRDVVDTLLSDLPLCLSGYRILDVGCGTGYFTEQLILRGASVVALDLSEKMLDQARLRCADKATYCIGDAESLPFADEEFDVAVSSLALQWCVDLSVPLSELLRVIKPTGSALFSTLVDGSLFELRKAWSAVDQYQHVKQFIEQNQVNIALAQAGSQSYHLDYKLMTYWYDSAFDLMKDLKGIGATQIGGRSQGLTKKSTLLKVEQAYQDLFQHHLRLPATYRVCLGRINK
ncbi:malonyl-[acyl-carrier protein] O-methyltransferase BioC [Vibrio sp. UCD-FRSSP16_10]|uniref:malonyl-ACP O-methyltransferase BioC n=1 Tax=unclassified Vibrio TaxID=2614977 RepID=UPI0007FE6526|nr:MULTISPECIES: malonyl-ACP O-methyltransferase BioC [unclassified Vibrio]OBT15990.1 malonyl-[acyl-carrier protein] O-methyltransferase BioC [Vibrio sp. UCD-FRSSP16_10]OBT18009.1 malonyl-[acyl-carrier protein] O-methyltransferase BioC [Vibrio sp. UCD-FRSSP16_30]